MPNIVALIPARGGSKGIPHKNIVPLAGKPLLSYSILAAQESKVFDAIYVSSDDSSILVVATEYDALLIERNAALAQDTTPTNAVIAEFISSAQLNDDDVIVLLQPTSPLRKPEHIMAALALFKQEPQCGALISVCEADNKYLYAYVGANPYITPAAPDYMKISRRQDLPAIYLPNGAIYIFTVKNFLREQAIPSQDVIAYIMPEADSIDIDTPADLAVAESYLTQ